MQFCFYHNKRILATAFIAAVIVDIKKRVCNAPTYLLHVVSFIPLQSISVTHSRRFFAVRLWKECLSAERRNDGTTLSATIAGQSTPRPLSTNSKNRSTIYHLLQVNYLDSCDARNASFTLSFFFLPSAHTADKKEKKRFIFCQKHRHQTKHTHAFKIHLLGRDTYSFQLLEI